MSRTKHHDRYRSTGWCKALGGAEGKSFDRTAAHRTGVANREARSARMDEILNRYLNT